MKKQPVSKSSRKQTRRAKDLPLKTLEKAYPFHEALSAKLEEVFEGKAFRSDFANRFAKNPQLSEQEKKFFIHTFLSTPGAESRWIPIPEAFKRAHGLSFATKSSNLFSPQAAALMHFEDYGGYAWHKGRCYSYRIDNDIFNQLSEAAIEDFAQVARQPKLPKTKNTPCLVHEPRDHNKNALKEDNVILRAFEQLDRCVLNDDELAKIKEEVLAGQIKGHQAMTFINFLHYITRQGYQPGQGYQLAYKVASTGRIFERGSGIQNLKKELKARLLDVPEVRNYDLRSSQVAVLIQELKNRGLPSDRFEVYLNDPEAKKTYSDELGITESEWKQLLYSKLFSGRTGKVGFYHKNAAFFDVVESIVYRKHGNWISFNTLYTRGKEFAEAYHKMVKPLDAELKAYHQHLLAEYPKVPGSLYENACGLNFVVPLIGAENAKLISDQKYLSKLSAHLIQGLESRFIHELTAESANFGFQVISNEHDGLTTIGVIPEAAIELARARSGLEDVELPEKWFT